VSAQPLQPQPPPRRATIFLPELGAQQVKNIARRVEVYRILDDPSAATAQPQRVVARAGTFSRITRRAGWAGLAVAAALGIVTCIAVWYALIQPKTPAALAGPPLMSVAVMPFTPASTSADDERVAERLTQDVTSGVERAQRSALVVSHGLVVARYKGKPTDARAVGHDLNVRYLVEGEVRDENGATVVIAQLVETTNGTVRSTPSGPSGPCTLTSGCVVTVSNGVLSAVFPNGSPPNATVNSIPGWYLEGTPSSGDLIVFDLLPNGDYLMGIDAPTTGYYVFGLYNPLTGALTPQATDLPGGVGSAPNHALISGSRDP
jgi:TolB-like protein